MRLCVKLNPASPISAGFGPHNSQTVSRQNLHRRLQISSADAKFILFGFKDASPAKHHGFVITDHGIAIQQHLDDSFCRNRPISSGLLLSSARRAIQYKMIHGAEKSFAIIETNGHTRSHKCFKDHGLIGDAILSGQQKFSGYTCHTAFIGRIPRLVNVRSNGR